MKATIRMRAERAAPFVAAPLAVMLGAAFAWLALSSLWSLVANAQGAGTEPRAAPPAPWVLLAQQMISIVGPVLVTAAGAWVTALVRTKVKNEAMAAALVQLEKHAEVAVLDTMAHVVRPARESTTDGTPVGQIAHEVAEVAKARAVDYVRRSLTMPAAKTLAREYGPDAFADVLDKTIEAAVERTKAPPAPPPTPSASTTAGGVNPSTLVALVLAVSLALAGSACARAAIIRAKGFEAASKECADRGWAWETTAQEEGPAYDVRTGATSGGVIVTYQCRPLRAP